MYTEWRKINQVPTKILSWGKNLTEANTNIAPDQDLHYIICITGNPGITECYIDFSEEIFRKMNRTVWLIGHTGHEVRDVEKMPPFEQNKHLYNLQGQIEHKKCFINTYVPEHAKITLIGHSIGSYIILNLLKDPSIRAKVCKSYLLFPAFERLAESKNGKIFMSFRRYFLNFLIPLIFVFNLCPLFIQNILVYIYCKITRMPLSYIDIIKNFLTKFTVRNVLCMALDEMQYVQKRDNAALEDNVKLLKLYYGATDGWTPLSYYNDIKRDIPGIDVEICACGIPHAFVLRHSKQMADIVADWMRN